MEEVDTLNRTNLYLLSYYRDKSKYFSENKQGLV